MNKTLYRFQKTARTIRESNRRKRQLKAEIVPASYRASIEDEDLKTFIAAGWIEDISINEIKEFQIQQCVDARCKCNVNRQRLYLIEQAVRGVSMQMDIVDAEARV